ncbi:hypothetical protein QBC42DRAFT_344519 [Cladorrhinum samala]|uniref:Uncharacterized protein n=1 Tax=Cladorrhinum samala TaxID=585594 RepID=A0AAV9HUP7_9PEZI|nr:hypothetical protein QBC42DRAFT_344519 [Cladorrhinum samala]
MMTETATSSHDRSGRLGRRRPFSTLMKKLANLKGVTSGEGHSKRDSLKIRPSKNNNPYPQSGRIRVASPTRESHYSVSSGLSGRTSTIETEGRADSVRISTEGLPPPTLGGRSIAPTVSTEHDTSRSVTAPSHAVSSVAGTSCTAHGRRADSTFSSPAPSVRSLATTLTTIQTATQNAHNNASANHGTNSNHHTNHLGSQVIHFNQPFPTASPASAIPAHLTPSNSAVGHLTTYHTATANNLLTDNASILTLASSSKRGRRRSFDTDASVRALAPSSLWGGSRESLPLSVLSANMDGATPGPATPSLHRTAVGAANGPVANVERASIYSATGILTASERNSFYAKGPLGGVNNADSASVRSGLFSHGRAESVSGLSIGYAAGNGGGNSAGREATSPLASPREGFSATYVVERDDEDDEGRKE